MYHNWPLTTFPIEALFPSKTLWAHSPPAAFGLAFWSTHNYPLSGACSIQRSPYPTDPNSSKFFLQTNSKGHHTVRSSNQQPHFSWTNFLQQLLLSFLWPNAQQQQLWEWKTCFGSWFHRSFSPPGRCSIQSSDVNRCRSVRQLLNITYKQEVENIEPQLGLSFTL